MRIQELMFNQFCEIMAEEERQDLILHLTDTSDYWLMWVSDMIWTRGAVFHHVFIHESHGGGYEGFVYRGFDTVDPIMQTGRVIDVEQVAGLWQKIMDDPDKSLEVVMAKDC